MARQIGRQGLRCLFHAIDIANHDNGAWRVRSHMLADRAQQHAGRGSAPSSPAMPLSKFQATQNRDGGLLTHSVKTLPGPADGGKGRRWATCDLIDADLGVTGFGAIACPKWRIAGRKAPRSRLLLHRFSTVYEVISRRPLIDGVVVEVRPVRAAARCNPATIGPPIGAPSRKGQMKSPESRRQHHSGRPPTRPLFPMERYGPVGLTSKGRTER